MPFLLAQLPYKRSQTKSDVRSQLDVDEGIADGLSNVRFRGLGDTAV